QRPGRTLLAAEGRLALLVVGCDALLGVVAHEQLLLQLALEGETRRERQLGARLHGALDGADGPGGLGGRAEGTSVLEHLGVESFRRDELVDETQAVRL